MTELEKKLLARAEAAEARIKALQESQHEEHFEVHQGQQVLQQPEQSWQWQDAQWQEEAQWQWQQQPLQQHSQQPTIELRVQVPIMTAPMLAMTLSQHWQQVGWQQEPRTNSKGGIYIKPPDARPRLNGDARPSVKKREKERQKLYGLLPPWRPIQ